MRKKFTSKNANALTFAVLMIPMLLVLAGLIIDGGYLFIRKAQLQSIADHSANAGISMIGDLLLDPTTTTDSILASEAPEAKAYEYIRKNNIDELDFTERDATYPYEYVEGNPQVAVKVTLAVDHTLYFAPMFGVEIQEISAEALSSITIN